MSQIMQREPLTAAKIARKKIEATELLATMRANLSNAELNAALLFVNDEVSAPYTIKELEMIVAGFVQVERVAEGKLLRHDYAEANERLQSLLPSTDSEERQRIANAVDFSLARYQQWQSKYPSLVNSFGGENK